MAARNSLQRALNAGQAPLARFFDPRFNALIERVQRLEDGEVARHAAVEARLAALEEAARTASGHAEAAAGRAEAAAESAAIASEWSRETVAALQAAAAASGSEPPPAPAPAPAAPGLDAVVDAFCGAALADLPPGAAVVVAGPGDAARRARVLQGLGLEARAVDPAEDTPPADAAVVSGDADGALRRVRPGGVLVAVGPPAEGATGSDPLGLGPDAEIGLLRLMHPSDTPDGVWRPVAVPLEDLLDAQRARVIVLVSALRRG